MAEQRGPMADPELFQLQQAVNASGEVVFMTNRRGVITFVNREFVRLYGYHAEEVVGRTTPRILKSGRTSPDTYSALWQQLLQGEVVRGELINRTKNGELVHVEFSANPVRDGQNEIVGFLGVQRDVTSRKRTETALLESESRYRTLAEAAHDHIFIIGTDGRIEYVNVAAAALFRLRPDEIIGKRLRDCFSPDLAATIDAEVRQVQRTGLPLYVEQPMQCPAGETWQGAWLAPIFDERQQVVGVMGISRDITERRRLATLLERHNGLLNAVVETSPIGIAVLEGPAFVCNTVNPAFQRLVPGAATGLALRGVWQGDLADVLRMFERVLATGIAAECVDVQLPEVSTTGGAKTRFSVTVTASQLLLPGCATPNLLVLMTDTTSRKHLEAQFYQAQKMEAVGRLAGGIAHDFNNLLTSILGYADLVMDTLNAADRRREDVEEIRRAGQSAAALTRQLLTFSRKQIAQPAILDVNAIVGQFDKIVRRTIGEDITLNLRLEPALDRIKMDAGQLEQILMNLSVNARDAMPHGGSLTIETANIAVREGDRPLPRQIPPGRYVVLTVADTGMGMSEEVQSRLFEPFFTTKEFGKGTGLGLSTVFGIVTQHDGYIGVSSQPNHGTSVTVCFPCVEPQKPVVTDHSPSEALKTGHETILIVEDDPRLRALVSKTLTRCGYITLTAGDAGEAMEVSDGVAGPIHLLVTDVVMPGTDGAGLARYLTARRAETRVLYMSGHTDGVISDHGVLNRGVQFLPKPFSLHALARKVREVLGPPRCLLPSGSPNSRVSTGRAASPTAPADARL